MLTFPEIHGLIVHLPILAVPVVAVLGFLRWKERGGAPVAAAEPWAFAVAIAGTALAVVSGLADFQEFAQTAQGAEQLAVGLVRGASPVALGRTAFRTGLGCGSCHGMDAQGGAGPCLSGGIQVDRFRHTHGAGLFPRSVVSDRMVGTINAWLETRPANGAVCHGDG